MSVTGSKLTTGKGDVILAAEVKSGNKTVTLRDAQGVPVWRGQGKGGRQRFLSPNCSGPGSTPIIRWEDFSFSGQKYLPKPGLHVTS